MIALNNVSYSYGSYSVLKNLNANFDLGKSYLIEGSNGSGKTTLLKLIAGLLEPTTGKISRLGKRIGFVGHQSMSYRLLTVDENIQFFSAFTEDREVPLNEWGLQSKRNSLVSTLSQGERMKLSILLALASNPEILLLDEPTSALDASAIDLLNKALKSLQPKTTIFIVTHDEKKLPINFDKRLVCPELSVR